MKQIIRRKTAKKNPYASQAQRRKFHAMEERGEISAGTVKEFDRASKGKKLPQYKNPSEGALKNAVSDLARSKGMIARDIEVRPTIIVFRDDRGYGNYLYKVKRTAKGISRSILAHGRRQTNGAKPATRAAIAARVKAKNPRDVYALYALLKRIKPGLSLRSLSRSELSEVYPLTVSGGQGLVKTENNKLVLSQKGIIAYKALHKSLGYKTKNSTASDFRKYQSNKLAELGRTFQGEHNGQKHRLLQSDFTPNDKYRLGKLVQIKIKANGYTVPLNFDGDSMLSADLRNNLHIVGKDARINPTNLRQYGIKPPTKGNMTYLGKLVQFDYVTAKKHIENGNLTRYFHKPGEVTKELPNVFVDHDGFPHIVGGGYDVWDVGVVN